MSLSQMHPSGGGPVSFFWGTIFAWWAHSRLGTQKPSLVRILLLHSRVKTKKKKAIFFANAPQWYRSCCFLFGHDFHLEDTFSLGGTKASYGTDFALTFGGENPKQKRSYCKCTPVASVLLVSFRAQFSFP